MPIRLRLHHVLCCIGFDGRGYDGAHLANIAHIVNGTLRRPDGPSTRVRITGTAGTLCAPCSLRRGLGCVAQGLVDALDARHGAALGLASGDVLSWGACLDRARAAVAPDDLDALCAGCRWQPLGICKPGVAALRAPNGSGAAVP